MARGRRFSSVQLKRRRFQFCRAQADEEALAVVCAEEASARRVEFGVNKRLSCWYGQSVPGSFHHSG